MFTGLVDHCGRVHSIALTEVGQRLWIETQFCDLKQGESVAVNGICLTVADLDAKCFACDISPETIRLTNCADLQVGTQVNLERALLPSDRMGGHFVSGHVDQVCQLEKIDPQNDYVAMSFTGISEQQASLLIHKGSIAINGVSLTLNQVSDRGFQVMLIPHTLACTNLKTLTVGQEVNIEFDMIAKMVARQTQAELVYE